jgi:hypothetical protein
MHEEVWVPGGVVRVEGRGPIGCRDARVAIAQSWVRCARAAELLKEGALGLEELQVLQGLRLH